MVPAHQDVGSARSGRASIVPHLVLVTATPMQMHPVEYFGDSCSSLGSPKDWSDFDTYEKSLQLIREDTSRPTLQQSADLGN